MRAFIKVAGRRQPDCRSAPVQRRLRRNIIRDTVTAMAQPYGGGNVVGQVLNSVLGGGYGYGNGYGVTARSQRTSAQQRRRRASAAITPTAATAEDACSGSVGSSRAAMAA